MPEPGRAAGPDEPGVRPDRARLVREFLAPGRGQFVLALVLALLGMSVVVQVRARHNDPTHATARRADLIQMVDGLDAEARRLETDLRALEDTKRQLEAERGSAEVARNAARTRLDELAILGGTAPAYGPGIRITITDDRRRIDVAMLLDAVEELRDAGAEAIEINDTIRVVAQSPVGGSPGGATVDGRPVTEQIVIDVIGEAHALEEAVRFRGGLATDVTAPAVGASISVARLDRVEVTSLHGVVAPQYARPAR